MARKPKTPPPDTIWEIPDTLWETGSGEKTSNMKKEGQVMSGTDGFYKVTLFGG